MTGWRAGFELVPTANWDPATVRTFLWDPVNGSDSNVGYSDAAGPYNPATQAKKTTAGMRAVIPVNFAGRNFRLIMASGSYSDGLDKLFAGATGYGATSVIRGTATSSTANTTAFSDDANDRIFQGWVTASGMNAAGYHPTGTPTTTVIQCLTLAGGAPGFGAEPALPLGARIRFDAATATTALRNIARMVSAVSGTDTVTVDSALPATPTSSDTFYIEMGGLAFPAHTISLAPVGGSHSALQICGLTSTGTIILGGGDFQLCGWKVNALIAAMFSSVTELGAFTEPTTGGSVTIGGGVRTETSATYTQGYLFQTSTHVSATGLVTYALNRMVVSGTVIAGAGMIPTEGVVVNPLAGRIIGPGSVGGVSMNGRASLSNLAITNMGAKPAIFLRPLAFDAVFLDSTVTGSSGNTDVGLDVTNARGALIYLASQPTVTGTAGDVRVAGGSIITWAQAFAGFTDSNGNRFVGSAATKYVVGRFSGQMPISGGAAFAYASDIGAQVETNTALLRRPTSARLITTVRLSAPAGTPAGVSLTATVYKNGVATALTCTIAAAQPAGTKAIGTSAGIIFSDGDDYDVRIDTGAATAATLQFSASVEAP